MNILIVEDAKYRIDWFQEKFRDHLLTIVSNANDATYALANPIRYDILFLDHDLSGRSWVDPSDEDSGSEIVRFMIKHNVRMDMVVIHSHNEPCALKMQSDLMDAGYMVCRTPFKSLAHKTVKDKFTYNIGR